jgi:hypothetical protein
MAIHRSFHGLVRASAFAVAFVATPSLARATDWYVDQSWTSCASSNGSQGNPYCTIGAAITAAASGDTILIAPGTYVEQLTVSKDLAFVGTAGAAVTLLDGGGVFRVMTLTAGTVVELAGLTIQNGDDTSTVDNCGGCYVDHATLTITDCVLSANEGAIEVSYGTLTMSRCLVTGNDASTYSGGAGISCFTPSTITVTDSSFDSNQAAGGGAIEAIKGALATIERCTFHANHAQPVGVTAGSGGALSGEAVTVVDCLFEANVAEGNASGYGGSGGAALVYGTCRFERCRFLANVADPTLGQSFGGAIYLASTGTVGGHATFVDCELVDNVCGSSANGEGGYGGGVYVWLNAAATFERCTLAGNRADGTGTVTWGGTGGGIWTLSGNPMTSLSHTIVAGNTCANLNGAPDATGPSIATFDWNVIGDTSGLTLLGNGPNDLLDVDPLFVDPANGDYSLQSISPAVESGNPTLALGGKDVAQASRVLDGNLDRVLRIDRGAREFGHVQLAVTGVFAPGGTLTVDTTGTAGLPVLLIAGEGESELALRPYGSLFVDLTLWNTVLLWGVIPNSIQVSIDPLIPVPLELHVQALATSGRAGNLSNLVSFTIE